MTDVVLIHPNGTHGIYGPLGDELVSREQPLWPRLVAGALLDRGVDVRIIDAEAQNLSPRRVADLVAGFAPKLACIVVSGHQPSASTQAMPGARAIAEELTLEKFSGSVVFMGNHPSALPEQTLREERCDFVIDGEGPTTIMGLLNDELPHDIPGLVFRPEDDRSAVIKNRPAPLLDIDRDLHGRAWHLLPPPDVYRSHNWQRWGDSARRSPYAAVHTSLGCPYTCSFCMINVFQHSNRYRMRNPSDVASELAGLYDHGVRTFKIVDELFLLNRRHVETICQYLADLKFNADGGVSIWCYGRTDTVDPDYLSLIRRAGIDWIALGIESGSAAVRDAARKHLDDDEIERVVRTIEKAGINVVGNYIFGLPHETQDTMEETLRLAQRLNTAHANFYVAMAYPGSRLYDDAVANGWRLPQTWAGYSQHNEFTTPLTVGSLAGLEARDILAFRDRAFDSYFRSAHYQAALVQRFGHAAKTQVEKMTSYKLKRNLLEATP